MSIYATDTMSTQKLKKNTAIFINIVDRLFRTLTLMSETLNKNDFLAPKNTPKTL